MKREFAVLVDDAIPNIISAPLKQVTNWGEKSPQKGSII